MPRVGSTPPVSHQYLSQVTQLAGLFGNVSFKKRYQGRGQQPQVDSEGGWAGSLGSAGSPAPVRSCTNKL